MCLKLTQESPSTGWLGSSIPRINVIIMLTLTLYYRTGCHLCEEMHDELLQFQQQQPFALHCVDIDEDSELQRRYHDKVPVLAHGEYEISYYFLERPVLIEYLRSV